MAPTERLLRPVADAPPRRHRPYYLLTVGRPGQRVAVCNCHWMQFVQLDRPMPKRAAGAR